MVNVASASATAAMRLQTGTPGARPVVLRPPLDSVSSHASEPPLCHVVDGYGSQRVTRFDKNFKEIKGDYRMPCCLHVVEWLPFGRPRKFKHVPQAA